MLPSLAESRPPRALAPAHIALVWQLRQIEGTFQSAVIAESVPARLTQLDRDVWLTPSVEPISKALENTHWSQGVCKVVPVRSVHCGRPLR